MSDERAKFTEVDEHVAANLQHIRKDRGLSQDELAQRMSDRGYGFTQATIWKIESGQRPVKVSEIVALGDALELRSWTQLTMDPEASRPLVQLQSANRAAHQAYSALKDAAAEYLDRQVDLAFAAHEARNAGLNNTHLWSSWLDTPAERAVIEARIDQEQDEEVQEHRVHQVDAALDALRKAGYEPLRPEDIQEITGSEPS